MGISGTGAYTLDYSGDLGLVGLVGLLTMVETWDWGLGGGLINWRWTTPRQRREQNNRGERQKYELLLIGKQINKSKYY